MGCEGVSLLRCGQSEQVAISPNKTLAAGRCGFPPPSMDSDRCYRGLTLRSANEANGSTATRIEMISLAPSSPWPRQVSLARRKSVSIPSYIAAIGACAFSDRPANRVEPIETVDHEPRDAEALGLIVAVEAREPQWFSERVLFAVNARLVGWGERFVSPFETVPHVEDVGDGAHLIGLVRMTVKDAGQLPLRCPVVAAMDHVSDGTGSTSRFGTSKDRIAGPTITEESQAVGSARSSRATTRRGRARGVDAPPPSAREGRAGRRAMRRHARSHPRPNAIQRLGHCGNVYKPARNVCAPDGTHSPVDDGQVRTPWADSLAVLFRHHTDSLCHVAQVMRNPCCQQLPKSDAAELRVFPVQRKLGVGQVPARERREALLAQSPKLIEEARKRLALTLAELSETVVRRKAAVRALGEDESCARNPVGAFAVDEVSYDVVWTPGFRAFGRVGPRWAQLMQQRM